jgi:hypothetical protein
MVNQKILENQKKLYQLWQFNMNILIGNFIEIDQNNRGKYPNDTFGIKDYFFFDYSSYTEYSQRDTIIPVDIILNKEELPSEDVIISIINNKEPVMKRVIDLNNQTENWVFVPTKETNK